jgi:hypothetical protein
MPLSPINLLLRVVHHMVNEHLNLYRHHTHQCDHCQAGLPHSKARFNNWDTLPKRKVGYTSSTTSARANILPSRAGSGRFSAWHMRATPLVEESLRLLSFDVWEHSKHAVRRLRQLQRNAETAVQICLSAQVNLPNTVMCKPAVLVAVSSPPNHVTGIFDINFNLVPLADQQAGFSCPTAP